MTSSVLMGAGVCSGGEGGDDTLVDETVSDVIRSCSLSCPLTSGGPGCSPGGLVNKFETAVS